MSGAAGGDDVVRLTEVELEGLIEAIQSGNEAEYVERLLADRLRAERAEGAREGWETVDAIADQRDQAELDAMQAKAETAEWVNAYDRELVRRKAAEVRAAAHATQDPT